MANALLSALLRVSEHGLMVLRPVTGPTGDIRDFVCADANLAAAQCLGLAESALVSKTVREGLAGIAGTPVFQAWVLTATQGVPDRRELAVSTPRGIRKLRLSATQADDR